MQQRWNAILSTFGLSNVYRGAAEGESEQGSGSAKRARSTSVDLHAARIAVNRARKKLKDGGCTTDLASSDEEKFELPRGRVQQVSRAVGAGRGRGSAGGEVRPGVTAVKRVRKDKSKTPREMVVSSDTSASEDTDAKERVSKKPLLQHSVFGTPKFPPPPLTVPQSESPSLRNGDANEEGEGRSEKGASPQVRVSVVKLIKEEAKGQAPKVAKIDGICDAKSSKPETKESVKVPTVRSDEEAVTSEEVRCQKFAPKFSALSEALTSTPSQRSSSSSNLKPGPRRQTRWVRTSDSTSQPPVRSAQAKTHEIRNSLPSVREHPQ